MGYSPRDGRTKTISPKAMSLRVQICALGTLFVCLALGSCAVLYSRQLIGSALPPSPAAAAAGVVRSVAALPSAAASMPAQVTALLALGAALDSKIAGLPASLPQTAPFIALRSEAASLRRALHGLAAAPLAAAGPLASAPLAVPSNAGVGTAGSRSSGGGAAPLRSFTRVPDADVPGNDMACSDSEVSLGCLLHVASGGAAAERCRREPACVAFVVVPPNNDLSGPVGVWLKSGSTNVVTSAAPGLVSFIKGPEAPAAPAAGGMQEYDLNERHDLRGGDFDCPRSSRKGECLVDLHSPLEAAKFCTSLAPQCVAFTCSMSQLALGSLPCWFKARGDPLQSNAATDTWVRKVLTY